MRILITGGAGFIGSHLAHFHLQNKDSVWVVDNLSTGTLENIHSIQEHPFFRFSKADLMTWEDLDRVIEWADGVYHLAAIVGQKIVINRPFAVLNENIGGCAKLLSAIRHSQKQNIRLLIASSSEVYGPNGLSSFKEDAPISFPSGDSVQVNYSLSKFVDENLALSCIHESNCECVIARLFNTTGPHQTGRYGMVVPSFIKQALAHEPITVYGSGDQSRSFCDIRDCISMLSLLMTNPKSIGKIFNVGNDREITILELAKLVKQITNSPSEIIHIPYEQAYGMPFKDTLRRCPDLTKMRTLFGFTPKWTLEQTINEMVQSMSAAIALSR